LGEGASLVSDVEFVRAHWLEQERDVYEYLLPHHVIALLELYRVNCVLDVGANRGQYGQLLRHAGYTGRIVSFEPVPHLARALSAVAARDHDWQVHAVALGRSDGTTTMNVVPGAMSSVLPATPFGAGRYQQLQSPTTQEVPLRRLDGMLDEAFAGLAEPRPYLKLDTQGFDLEAFGGLGRPGRRGGRHAVGDGPHGDLRGHAPPPRRPRGLRGGRLGVTGFYPVTRQYYTGRVLEFDCVMVRASAR
jgi:FkbM family methyltransferase